MERNYIRDGRAPIPLKESTSRVMSSNKGINTKPELLVRKELFSRGYRGYRLHLKTAPGKPDIVFTRSKVAIFVNGCFWHRCPKCSPSTPKTHVVFWKIKFEKNVKRDKEKIKKLHEMGWKVIVLWECEIKKDVNSCSNRIIDLINPYQY